MLIPAYALKVPSHIADRHELCVSATEEDTHFHAAIQAESSASCAIVHGARRTQPQSTASRSSGPWKPRRPPGTLEAALRLAYRTGSAIGRLSTEHRARFLPNPACNSTPFWSARGASVLPIRARLQSIRDAVKVGTSEDEEKDMSCQ